MVASEEEWRPGSFTKNFSWGTEGLSQLRNVIRVGFGETMRDVPRTEFRRRLVGSGRPDFIPINFFLFNKVVDGENYVIADELVFEALTGDHSPSFDKLALFAFNFSFAGKWTGANTWQRRPALWANAYIRERVAKDFNWDASRVNSDDIQYFISNDRRYTGQTARKLATNLNYLYSIGQLREFPNRRVERWWVDALFLALDRIIEDRKIDGYETASSGYAALLDRYAFLPISGGGGVEKTLALKHLIELYSACGGRERFSDERVLERTNLLLPDVERFIANDYRPRGAVHPTNPSILKTIPSACAMLARYAGFEVIDPEQLENFDLEEFVRTRTREALRRLRDDNVRPIMSAEELMRLTRER